MYRSCRKLSRAVMQGSGRSSDYDPRLVRALGLGRVLTLPSLGTESSSDAGPPRALGLTLNLLCLYLRESEKIP